MPLYQWRCNCGEERTTSRGMAGNTMDKTCPGCGEEMSRCWTAPAFHRFESHFNPTVGKEVGSRSEFKRELKRAAEEQTAKDGIPRNYVPMDMEKPKEGPGTDEQARKHRDLGTPGFERKRLYFNT